MVALIKQPDAREKKPEFSDLPPTIFRQLEKLCGDKIVSSGTAFGGLSASAGFIMTLASGRKVFAKGTHPAETAHGSATHHRFISAWCPMAKKTDGCSAFGNASIMTLRSSRCRA